MRDSLEKSLGHEFRDASLLVRALTHSSRAHEEGDALGGNERLEFLGDAVLDLVISQMLMELLPQVREGVLSQARAAAVNQTALAKRARELDLNRFVRLGRGEDQSGGRDKPSILANVFEALVGALYLDAGFEGAATFIRRHFRAALESPREILDPKTRLQEWLQKRGEPTPEYVLVSAEGPDHAREFCVAVRAGQTGPVMGCGRSKREAEQAAARAAMQQLDTGPGDT